MILFFTVKKFPLLLATAWVPRELLVVGRGLLQVTIGSEPFHPFTCFTQISLKVKESFISLLSKTWVFLPHWDFTSGL